ncbi:MAG: Ribonuclease H [candidate division TM6 bacterium GW2011_GWF2_38_10]|nr:MAG: Ribonuclease H [candidate division TM6 bacterium GW2011_GWF2_38_10]
MEKQLTLFSSSQEPSVARIEFWNIRIDGAARGNPGPAGAGVVLQRPGMPPVNGAIYLGNKTNNQAEYIALAYALHLAHFYREQEAQNVDIKLVIYSDSQLLVRQMNKEYRVKNESLALIKKNIDALLLGWSYAFVHVMRENNKAADALANEAIDKKKKIPTDFLKFLADCGLVH